MNNHHRIYLEDIWSRFNQVRPVVSHIEVHLRDKCPTTNNIGESLKGPHRQLYKKDLFVQ